MKVGDDVSMSSIARDFAHNVREALRPAAARDRADVHL